MTSDEAIAYIETDRWNSTRLGLERIRELLLRLGNPEKSLKFIHTAGSNGKGSTCAMLERILREAGYRTGLYTSPYIRSFYEQIQISGEFMDPSDLARITELVRKEADAMEDHPSRFELLTAIAMLYFKEQQCDIVVLEVGMGGALDSTNVIEAPEAAVITNIGLDHTEYLGNTLAEIAAVKAGIIKPGCTVISYESSPEVLDVLYQTAAENHADFRVARVSEIAPVSLSLDGSEFICRGESYHLSLLGVHQLSNAAVVLETIKALREKGWVIPEEAVQRGLRKVTWPVRFEVMNRNPLFVIDGGHNPQCTEVLTENLDILVPETKSVFLLGVLADKDYRRMTELLLPYASEFICLTPLSPRALPAGELARCLREQGAEATYFDSISEGLSRAFERAGNDGSIIAFGSLYLVGAIRSAFQKENHDD